MIWGVKPIDEQLSNAAVLIKTWKQQHAYSLLRIVLTCKAVLHFAIHKKLRFKYSQFSSFFFIIFSSAKLPRNNFIRIKLIIKALKRSPYHCTLCWSLILHWHYLVLDCLLLGLLAVAGYLWMDIYVSWDTLLLVGNLSVLGMVPVLKEKSLCICLKSLKWRGGLLFSK